MYSVPEDSQSETLGGEDPLRSLSTEFLLEPIRAGNSAAWGELYRRYRPGVLAQIRSRMPQYLRRRFDEEDVLQQSFARAWSQLEKFSWRGEGSFRRWIFVLVYREFLNLLRSRQGDRGLLGESQAGDLDARQAPALGGSEALSALESLGQLPPVERNILIMHHVDHLGFAQIGAALGYSRKVALREYRKAVEHLRRASAR